MEMTLLLNATYEPLRVVHWQKAITLLWQGKVEVLEVYDREVHAVSISIKLPSVMRLLNLVRLKEKPVKPRWNPVVTITIGIRNTPDSWRDYFYWNMELDADPPET